MGTVFQDEFQSGTILTTDNPPGAWTSKTAYTDVVSSPFRRGPYAAEASGGSNHYWEKVLGSSYSELYFAGYVQFPVLPGNNNTASFLKILSNSGTYWVAGGLNTDASGNMKWALFINGYLFVANSYYTANTDQWYFIEIEYKQGTGTGVAKMWVDSNLWLEITGLSLVEAAQRVQGGNVYTISQPFVSYGDNYVASTTHISANGNSELHNLSVDNTLTMKTYEGNWLTIETTTGNILQISQAVNVLDDINAYGFLGTATDPNKSSGGGAIQMGHGFEYSIDPPRINLTDEGYHELCITAGSTYDYEHQQYLGVDDVLADVRLQNLTAKGTITFGSYPVLSADNNSFEHLKIQTSDGYVEIGIEGVWGIGWMATFATEANCFTFGKSIIVIGDVVPWPGSPGTYNIGSSSAYWNQINYKTLYDRGCPVWMESKKATEIMKGIRPHATLKSMHKLEGKEVAQFDQDSLPPDFKPEEGNGLKFDLFVYTMYHSMRDLIGRTEELENENKSLKTQLSTLESKVVG